VPRCGSSRCDAGLLLQAKAPDTAHRADNTACIDIVRLILSVLRRIKGTQGRTFSYLGVLALMLAAVTATVSLKV
jgi:hypothetical protein